MKSLLSIGHELALSSELDKLYDLAHELPDRFDDLQLYAVPDRTVASYSGIALDNSHEVPDGNDGQLSTSYTCEGNTIKDYSIALFSSGTPYYYTHRKPDGEWTAVEGGEPAGDSDVLSYLIARTPEPKTEDAKQSLAIELDNPLPEDIVGYAENVLRELAVGYATERSYKADCMRFVEDGGMEAFQVELSYTRNGETLAKTPRDDIYILHVTRPIVIDGELTTEHLQLACRAPGTALTNRSYELPGGEIKQADIDDAPEFLYQMQSALNYLLEQKYPVTVE